MEAAEQPLVEPATSRDDAGERVGDLGLRVPVRREGAADDEELHCQGSPLLVSLAARVGGPGADRTDGLVSAPGLPG